MSVGSLLPHLKSSDVKIETHIHSHSERQMDEVKEHCISLVADNVHTVCKGSGNRESYEILYTVKKVS